MLGTQPTKFRTARAIRPPVIHRPLPVGQILQPCEFALRDPDVTVLAALDDCAFVGEVAVISRLVQCGDERPVLEHLLAPVHLQFERVLGHRVVDALGVLDVDERIAQASTDSRS